MSTSKYMPTEAPTFHGTLEPTARDIVVEKVCILEISFTCSYSYTIPIHKVTCTFCQVC